MTPEKKVQTATIRYLKKLQEKGQPIYFERREAGGFAYKTGSADLWLSVNGYHIEVEIKYKGGKLSIMQEMWERKCVLVKMPYIVIHSLEDISLVLEPLLKKLGIDI